MSDHPDLDALSVYLDTESDAEGSDGGVGAHVSGCAACRAGVERLRAVRDALAAQPVPVASDAVRERTIAAALAAADEWMPAPPAAPLAPSVEAPQAERPTSPPAPAPPRAARGPSPTPSAEPSRFR